MTISIYTVSPELMEMVFRLYSFQEDSEQCEQKNDGDGNEGKNVNWVKMVNRGENLSLPHGVW